MKIVLKTSIWWIARQEVQAYATLHMKLSKNGEVSALWGAPCISRGTPGLVLKRLHSEQNRARLYAHELALAKCNHAHLGCKDFGAIVEHKISIEEEDQSLKILGLSLVLTLNC